jgi:hypothetical protein
MTADGEVNMMRETDRDILISRVIDDEASAADWAQLKALAASEPQIWRDLFEMQRGQSELARAVESQLDVAEYIDAPVQDHLTAQLTQRVRRGLTWAGWAAAAAVAVAWVGIGAPEPGSEFDRPIAADLTPTQLLEQYMEKGRESGLVQGEAPAKTLLSAQPAPSGVGYEVFYIRQIVERAIVTDLYQLGSDDAGNPHPVRLRFNVPADAAPGSVQSINYSDPL